MMQDVQFFSAETKAFQDAGNLEETLAHYLLLGTTLEHLLPLCNGAVQTKYKQEYHRVTNILQFLHQKVQSKADSYYGCLNPDDKDTVEWDNELLEALQLSPSATVSPMRIPHECESIQPVNTLPFEDITLSSIVGNDAIKQDIIDGIVRPFQQPLLFKMRRSFLFYGPPGTGKTMFAKASANTLQHMSKDVHILFFSPTTDALKDKHVGGTERKITQYFKCVHLQTSQHERDTHIRTIGVIFIDEIDSLARSRGEDDAGGTQASATNTLLQMMDGFQTYTNIIVMAATNYPWQLDDAVRSRFQEHIYVRLPDTPTIVELLKYNFKQYYQS
ncbi:MAG TPA: ATP-binding protein, partial [Flavobacteriales bacterium]|nr:ATP-binding protein [Flavobacteriales bacterium]